MYQRFNCSGLNHFFLDYIAVGKLDLNKKKFKRYFKGCSISKCKLIGGETAEMPGTY